MATINYMTTNLLNGMQYIGMHVGDISDNYLGSGKLLKPAIKKYGKHNFKRTTIWICDNVKEAHENETKFIQYFNTLHPNGYNLSPTGGAGEPGFWKHTSESKKKISENSSFRRPEVIEKITNKRIGRPHPAINKRNKGEWKPTEEQKQKMRHPHKKPIDTSNYKGCKIPWNKGLKKQPNVAGKIKKINVV